MHTTFWGEKNPKPLTHLFLDKVGPYFYHVSCVLNVLHGGTKQGKGYAAAYARTSFTYARYSTLRRPYADKF
jgi:hypothetical protein